MSISQVAPQAPTAQAPSAPNASPSDPNAVNKPTPSTAATTTKLDADGDFDGSKSANDDAVKVSLSQEALQKLAANKKNG